MEPRPSVERRSGRGERQLTRRISSPWPGIICAGVLLLVAGCGAGGPLPVSGLRPEYPEVRRGRVISWPVAAKVGSLQPTFRWESFPRPHGHEADKAVPQGRISNVTYDIKIWRPPAELVYAREGLPEPSHTIEEPLAPRTFYYWTVRARFELDGHPRVTDWGRWKSSKKSLKTYVERTWGPNSPEVKVIDYYGREMLVVNPMFFPFQTPRK